MLVALNWWQHVPKPQGFLTKGMRQGQCCAWGIFRGDPHPYQPTKEENFNAPNISTL